MPRIIALFLLFAAVFPTAAAQPLGFGSADDPMEQPRTLVGAPRLVAAAYAGPTHLNEAWRTAGAFVLEGQSGPCSFALDGILLLSTSGFYDPDTDETYDIARLLRYVRHDPSPSLPVYARIGPTTNVSLGRGHLVRSFRTTTSIDERTVGAEFAFRNTYASFGAFTGDVRMNNVIGAFAEVAPVRGSASPLMSSLRLGAGIVHSLADTLGGSPSPTALQFEVSADLLQYGEFSITPFASYAEFLHYGRSVGGGVDMGSENLIGAALVNLRLGLFFSGDGFVPGYFNPFYSVSNDASRIVTADSFFDADTLNSALAGTPLGDVTGGVDLLAEVELLAFRSFEISYHFRRHYGDQRLSDFSLRVASRPRFLDGLRIEFGMERQGLGSFFTLFTGLKDQNALVFNVDFPLAGSAHLSIRSRYGYRRLPDADDGTGRYIVQRRFEPLIGVRYRF
ncbi:MAG: hypothetical protein IIC18_02385 [Bacteroidetes bacterium]|nr:hypothetical protein [Bacteroidota bacterium]